MAKNQSLTSYLLSGAIYSYQLLLKPLVGMQCRFIPSCSHYGLEAIKQYGATQGLRLIIWRLLRCHPGCAGGYDPVPQKNQLNPNQISLGNSDGYTS